MFYFTFRDIRFSMLYPLCESWEKEWPNVLFQLYHPNKQWNKAWSLVYKKKETMDTLAQQKSPVKVKNYKYSYKYGKKDIVIHKNTVFTPITETPSFPYINQEQVLSIASLTKLILLQISWLISKVISPTSTQQRKSSLMVLSKKHEGYVNDPSGYIKIVLRGSQADLLQEGQTYNFNKIRIRENYGHQRKKMNAPLNALNIFQMH